MEVHDNPSKALSDANTVLDIKYLERILAHAKKAHELRLEDLINGEKTMSTENNLKVSDVILKLDEIPVLRTNDMVKQALEKMSALKLGVVCVVDSSNLPQRCIHRWRCKKIIVK